MTLDRFIEQLEEIREHHGGDVDVFIVDPKTMEPIKVMKVMCAEYIKGQKEDKKHVKIKGR